jgi:hypothetical protein
MRLLQFTFLQVEPSPASSLRHLLVRAKQYCTSPNTTRMIEAAKIRWDWPVLLKLPKGRFHSTVLQPHTLQMLMNESKP